VKCSLTSGSDLTHENVREIKLTHDMVLSDHVMVNGQSLLSEECCWCCSAVRINNIRKDIGRTSSMCTQHAQLDRQGMGSSGYWVMTVVRLAYWAALMGDTSTMLSLDMSACDATRAWRTVHNSYFVLIQIPEHRPRKAKSRAGFWLNSFPPSFITHILAVSAHGLDLVFLLFPNLSLSLGSFQEHIQIGLYLW
jgi:hypothetical protein